MTTGLNHIADGERLGTTSHQNELFPCPDLIKIKPDHDEYTLDLSDKRPPWRISAFPDSVGNSKRRDSPTTNTRIINNGHNTLQRPHRILHPLLFQHHIHRLSRLSLRWRPTPTEPKHRHQSPTRHGHPLPADPNAPFHHGRQCLGTVPHLLLPRRCGDPRVVSGDRQALAGCKYKRSCHPPLD